MESSSDSKPSDSFKSKKTLHFSSSQNPSPSHGMTTKPVVPGRAPWSTPTPEKPDLIGSSDQQIGSRVGKSKRKVDGSVKLPEKYEILGKFFDSLERSISRLRSKGYMSTFTNISPIVEHLTDRRFSYAHLAQLKFILPEVIETKKVSIYDERTDCYKPDLRVELNVDATKNEGKLKSANGNSYTSKIFHSRLLDFCKAHPEEDDVPQENLPEPFNKPNIVIHTGSSNASAPSVIGETSIGVLAEQQPAAATHLPRTFRKSFSQKVSRYATTNSDQEKGTVLPQPSTLGVSEIDVDRCSNEGRTSASSAPSISKCFLKPSTTDKCSSHEASQASVAPSHPHTIPLKKRDLDNETSSVGTATVQGTPAKLVSTPVKLMSDTPALQTPKRSYMSPDDCTTSQNKLVRRPVCNRSLKFDSPVKNAEIKDEVNHIGGLSVDNDIFDILPEDLLESIKEKERKALEEKDPAISQAKRRQKMIAGLPKFFDMTGFLFQSINRSVVTKAEFVYRMVANDLDIVDRREVEEELKLLLELAPEWIYEKLASSGDLLICINKRFSTDSMRARLVKAK